MILGDFNFPDVRWFDGLPDGSKKVEEDLAEALNDTNLVQLVNQPTRFRAQQAPSLLDLVFTNEPDATTLLTYLPPIGSSDHVTISLQLQCLLRRQPPPTTRSRRVRYFNLDYDRVVQVIAPPTHEFLTTDNPSIHDTLLSISPPEKKPSVRYSGKPWISRHIRQDIKRKRRLWYAYRRTGSSRCYEKYRRHNNFLNGAVRRARMRYEETMVDAGGIAFFAYIGRATSTIPNVIPCVLVVDDVERTELKVLSDAFAKEFASVYTCEPAGPLNSCGPPMNV